MANLKYYNNSTSKWEEIKVSTRFKELLNTKKLIADQNYVNIEITNYNPNEDVLFVILNSTWLQKDEDYVINGGLLRIESKDGSNWINGDTFNFVVLKNVDKDAIPTTDGSLIQDGSITIAKLATSLQNYINKIGDAELTTITDDLSGAINEINTQLSKNVQQIHDAKTPTNYKGAVLCFVDDDGYSSVLEKWKPIADEKGIDISLGIITSLVGQTNYLSLSDLHNLENQGFSILSHTKTHPHMDAITTTELITELKDSRDFLRSNGFKDTGALVYPYGFDQSNITLKNTIRQYYNYGINAWATYNTVPIDNFWIQRIDGDQSSYDVMKPYLDNAIANNGLLVIMTHCGLYPTTFNDSQKLELLIDYAKSQNVPILNIEDALEYFGNVISAGDYTDSDNFILSKNGKTKGLNNIKYLNDQTLDIDRVITEYEAETITVQPVSYSHDTVIGAGGIITTYRQGLVDSVENYSYQIYTQVNSSKMLKRIWINGTGWGSWTKINSEYDNVFYLNNENSNIDRAITEYTAQAITIQPFSYSYDTAYGSGGVIKTYRNGVIDGYENYSYQEYTSVIGNVKLQRFWLNSGSWSAWSGLGNNIYSSLALNTVFSKKMTDYTKNMITYETVSNTNASSAPIVGIGGTLTTYRFSDDNYGWQEYKAWNSKTKYQRTWYNSTWNAWEQVC